MDPCSAIGVISASLSIVTTIGSTVKGLAELRNKFIAADQSIRSLITQLSTIKAALNLIHDWAENDLVVSPTQGEFVDILDVAIDGCRETMDALAEEVANLVGSSAASSAAEKIGFRTRTKFVWNEGTMAGHQNRLQSQVAALQFLVTAVQSQSPRERNEIIHETRNKEIIQKVADDTSTLRASRAASTENSQVAPTIVSHSNSTIDARSYAIDPLIVNTRAYRRVEEYRRAVGHNDSDPNIGDVQVTNIEGDPEVESTSDIAQTEGHLSPTWQNKKQDHRRRPSYEATVVSDPGPVHRKRYSDSEYNITQSEPVVKEASRLQMRQKAQGLHKIASRLLSGGKDKAESPGRIDFANSGPQPRRGRRGFEDNYHQSIDFSLSDSLSVPPIVRAAQAGSTQEVEQLLDRNADIEERHVSSGKSALSVAAHCGNDAVVDLLLHHGAKTDHRDASRSTPLHLASSRGHLGAMRLLLRHEVLIEERDAEGRTPLWLASGNGHLEAVELLLARKAKINARAEGQRTSLHAAAQRGDAQMIDLLLRYGAHIDAKDAQFMSALHYACDLGHANAVSVLIQPKHRADIESPGNAGKTPLICAAAAGQRQVLEILLKRKASVKSLAEKNMNALHFASQYNHAETVEFLLTKKIPINSVTLEGRSALHLAVISRAFDVVELLLRMGADRECRCHRNYTALHYGCSVGTRDIVEFLLRYGARIEATTREDERPLHIAVMRGSCDIVKVLLSSGANPDARNKFEDRALCLACSRGDIDVVKALLEAGTPLRSKFSNSPKSKEDSPLCVAARHGHLEICSLLIARGASVRQKDELQWQPLRYAAYYGHPEIVQFLLSKGAEVSTIGASGGWGFEVTASRIGFANNIDIPQQHKEQVTSLLRSAEERENSVKAQESAFKSVSGPLEAQFGPSELPARYPPLQPSPPHTQKKGWKFDLPSFTARKPHASGTSEQPSSIAVSALSSTTGDSERPPSQWPESHAVSIDQRTELIGDLIDFSTAPNSRQNSGLFEAIPRAEPRRSNALYTDVHELSGD